MVINLRLEINLPDEEVEMRRKQNLDDMLIEFMKKYPERITAYAIQD